MQKNLDGNKNLLGGTALEQQLFKVYSEHAKLVSCLSYELILDHFHPRHSQKEP